MYKQCRVNWVTDIHGAKTTKTFRQKKRSKRKNHWKNKRNDEIEIWQTRKIVEQYTKETGRKGYMHQRVYKGDLTKEITKKQCVCEKIKLKKTRDGHKLPDL